MSKDLVSVLERNRNEVVLFLNWDLREFVVCVINVICSRYKILCGHECEFILDNVLYVVDSIIKIKSYFLYKKFHTVSLFC